MAIPGYDPGTVTDTQLDSVGARIAVVAAVVPDEFALERSSREPPIDALSKPVDCPGLEGVKALEAVRISLAYDPSKLPPGASPTDVAVAVETDGGWDALESTVDLAATTVEAVLNETPPGSTFVAGYDDSDVSGGLALG